MAELGAAQPAASDVRVLFIERAHCHLCDEARAVVERVCQQAGLAWRSVDVDSSAGLREAWGELVPVVLVDGVVRGQWGVDAARLAAALDG